MYTYNQDEIKSIINEIRSKVAKGYTEKSLIKQYIGFFETYPAIFRMAVDPTFDFKYLDYMFEMKTKITGTESNLKSLDKEVYGTLMQEYIPENLRDKVEEANQATTTLDE